MASRRSPGHERRRQRCPHPKPPRKRQNLGGQGDAFTGIEIVAALAVIGLATWIFAPSVLPGASKRAAQSTAATARVEQTATAQGSAVAASIVEIGKANTEAPESPSRDFIAKEIPVALASLPAPDAQRLLEAERRRAAVMEGRADEARKLYELAAKQAAHLQHERDEAIAARRNADLALEKSAAAEHARSLQAVGLGVIALIAAAANSCQTRAKKR